MTRTAYFEHALTGKVDKYPENFGDLFPETLKRVDEPKGGCLDCGPKGVEEDFQADFGTDSNDGEGSPADENEAE